MNFCHLATLGKEAWHISAKNSCNASQLVKSLLIHCLDSAAWTRLDLSCTAMPRRVTNGEKFMTCTG